MKRNIKTLIAGIVSFAFLASCNGNTSSITDTSSTTSASVSQENSTVSSTSASSSSEHVVSSSPSSSKEDSSDKNSASSSVEKPTSVTVFSINDVHGCLEMNEDSYELGLARLDYAIRHDPDYDPETSILISCGDIWQGGYLAHEDPTLVTTLLEEMDVSAFVIGNHEFDWGTETLAQLSAQSDFPFLGCNIFSDKAETTKENWYSGSTVVEKGGVRYGIIGGIGPEEESDISVSSLGTYSFSDDATLFDTEYQALQAQGCDLILLAMHAGSTDRFITTLGNRYLSTQISGIFGAHTHLFESTMIGNLPFVQGGSNSKGYTKMTFNLQMKIASGYQYKNCSYSTEYFGLENSVLNQTMVSAIEASDVAHNGSTALCTFNGTFRKGYELNKFLPDSMVAIADKHGWGSNHSGNELMAIHNSGGIRSDLPSGVITEKILFKFSPFDNKVKVIQNVSGSDISKLIGTVKDSHSSSYYVFSTQSGTAFDKTKTYDIVTIDYVSEGSYFSHITGTQYDIGKDNVDPVMFIRNAISEFISSPSGQTFNASDYYPY